MRRVNIMNKELDEPIFLVETAFSQFDNDCACPDKGLGLTIEPLKPESAYSSNFLVNFDKSKYSLREDVFCQTKQTHVQKINEKFYLLMSPYTSNGPCVVTHKGFDRWKAFEEPLPLEKELDFLFLEQGLLHAKNNKIKTNRQTPETLEAWIHVTNACNLDCPYCYVRKSSARMSVETGERTIESIFHTATKHGFKNVKLKYAGGEATLHFALVKRLHNLAQQLADTHGIGLREVVLSNGVRIKEDDAIWLKQHDVKLMVSLDGIGEVHDQQRPFLGGQGSFRFVEKTIDEVLLPNEIFPDITITITALNAWHIAEVVEWCLKRELPVSLNFFRENLLTKNRQELELEEKSIIEGMLAAYDVFKRYLPERPFLNGLLDRVQTEPHAHTCGVNFSYLVFTHEGHLTQCQMHLDDHFEIPAEQRDLLPIMQQGPIQNVDVEEKEGCKTCEFRYRCSGGCPLETFRATGRWDVKSPHCYIYKTLYPEALKLEGLRLLKVHGLMT